MRRFYNYRVTLHFYLLDILADGKAYSAAELLELLCSRYFNCFDNQLRQPDESAGAQLFFHDKMGLLLYY